MPFKSEAQRRKFYAMEDRGEISKGTTARWEDETKDKDLPEKVRKKESAFARAVVATLEKSARVDPQKVEMLKQMTQKVLGKSRAATTRRVGAEMGRLASDPKLPGMMARTGMDPGELARLNAGARTGPLYQPKLSSAFRQAVLKQSAELTEAKLGSAEVAGAALWGSALGYRYLGGILKEATERRKLAADPLEEQRKQQIHEQQMQFADDKHEVELQQMQMNLESQQASQKMKAQQTEDKFKQDSEAKKQEAAQVQQMQQPPASNPGQQNTKRRQNLMTSQSPPAQQ